MISIFILHSSHDFYISACLDESLIDDHLLTSIVNNNNFKPKTIHKIKLDVVFSSNIMIRNYTFQKPAVNPPSFGGGSSGGGGGGGGIPPSYTENNTSGNSNSRNVSTSQSNTYGSSANYHQQQIPSYQNVHQETQIYNQNLSSDEDIEKSDAMTRSFNSTKRNSTLLSQSNTNAANNLTKTNVRMQGNFYASDPQNVKYYSNINFNNPKYYQQYPVSNETYQPYQPSYQKPAKTPYFNQIINSSGNQFGDNQNEYFQHQHQPTHQPSTCKRYNSLNAHLNALASDQTKYGGQNISSGDLLKQNHNSINNYITSNTNKSQARLHFQNEFQNYENEINNAKSKQQTQANHNDIVDLESTNSSNSMSSGSMSNGLSNNLENRVLESYLKTIRKTVDNESGVSGTNDLLYKNYSHSDSTDVNEYNDHLSENASFNKSI